VAKNKITMLGFELKIKGKKITAALENGVVSIIATQISKDQVNSLELDLKGLDISDLTGHESVDWYHTELKEGDEFIVTVRDILESSAPQSRKKRDRDSEHCNL
jgi:hypothetical protein